MLINRGIHGKKRSWLVAGAAVLALRLTASFYLALVSAFMPMKGCSDFPCSETLYEEMTDDWFSRHFLAPWYRWDTVHYLDIAESGYEVYGFENTVWPPLYPLLIGVFSSAVHPMAAALAISTLSIAAAFFILHREVGFHWNEDLADRTILMIVVFPTSFFLVAGYSEALFLSLSLAVFYALRRRRWLLAGGFAALGTLTRLQGIFLVLPIAWEVFQWIRTCCFTPDAGQPQNNDLGGKRLTVLGYRIPKRALLELLSAIMLPPLAIGLYFLFVHYTLDAPWPWQTLSTYWGQHIGWPGEGVFSNLLFLFQNKFSLTQVSMFYDVFVLLLFTVMLVKKTAGMPGSFILYGLVMLLLPSLRVSDNWSTMASMARYALPVFPAFIALAFFMRNHIGRLSWLTFSFTSQMILLFLFSRWFWVA